MKILEFLKEQVKTGMSQKEIAEKIGMFPSSLNKIMKGREPELKTLHKIAKAFHVPVSMFLNDERPSRIFTNKELLLLDMIEGNQELLNNVIKHTEKEKLYAEITKTKAA